MNSSRLQVAPDLWLDARRAIFLSETRTLAIADLHLGYAWAHRHGGQLLPVSRAEDTLPRLLDLVESYAPRELVLLGDIVHRAVAVEALKHELCGVINALNERLRLILVAGNHDRNLRRLLVECGLTIPVATDHESPPHFLVHGDSSGDIHARRAVTRAAGGRVIIGHEHPAITISDGVATRAKCPCFLLSDDVIVLPAFSRWAAGTDVRSHEPMSPWAAGAVFSSAVAILGAKLLPVAI